MTRHRNVRSPTAHTRTAHSCTQCCNAGRASALQAGDDIIVQGDVGDRFYVQETGATAVIVNGNKVRALRPVSATRA